MLRYMRTHAASWGIKIILGLIIVVFIFWGVGRIESKKKTVVAQVGKRYITIAEFDRAYREALDFYRNLFGEALTPQRLRELKVGKEVLSRLIRSSLLLQEAEKWGLRVSTDELRELIINSPVFQRDGRFDRGLYLSFLRRRGVEPAEFEEGLRRQILMERAQRALSEGVFLSNRDLKELFSRVYEELELEFVLVPFKEGDGGPIAEGELLRYFSEHQEEFRLPEKVRIAYLRCSPQEVMDEVGVTDQEVEDYYERNPEAFRIPPMVKIRHIFIRVSKGKEEAKKRAEELLKRIKAGEDFGALAKEYSEDPLSAARGGDLGYISREGLDPEFARTVFSMKKGEIKIVRSAHGYHLVEVQDVKEGHLRPLEEVRDQIVRRLRLQKAEDLCALKMADAAYGAKKVGDLKSYGEKKGLKVWTPPPFSRSEEIEGLGKRTKLIQVAFSLGPKEISSWVEDGGEFFVLQCLEKIPPRTPSFEEVKDKVEERLRKERARKAARELAEEVLRRWKEGDVEAFLEERGLEIQSMSPRPRSEAIFPEFGLRAPELALLTRRNPFAPRPFETSKGYLVVHLKEVRPPSEGLYKDQEKAFRSAVEEFWRKEVLNAWFRKRADEVKIELNPTLLARYGIEGQKGR
ncbi:MAG TPA: hypothetical protein ENF44_05695 [Deltaproteobacteria bacterium]|nr:hypothetical protein [Deltaproteobacteria bacterium]